MGILKGYVNKENNSNRIYSREDIGKMSTAEYSENEKAIDHQMRTVGVPTNNDLKNSSDVVYVSAYKRADGTEVNAYYRSKPDGIGSNNSSNKYSGGIVAPIELPTGGDLIPDGVGNPMDKILNFLKGGYTGGSILPTDDESPLDKIGSGDIVSQLLNMITGDKNDLASALLNVISGGNVGDFGKISKPEGEYDGGAWDEKIPQDETDDSTIPDLTSMANPLSAILDYIKTGKIDIDKLLPMPEDNGEVLDEKFRYPWETQEDKEDKKSKKKEEDKKEKEKVSPLADLLNYAITGNFNKDQFIDHLVRTNVSFGDFGESDMNNDVLLKMVKKSNEQINFILDSVVSLLPQESKVTDAVKGLVQFKKQMGEQFETMLDPEKAKEQMIGEVKQWVSDFSDFTGQIVSGDFENIKWDEIGQKLNISQIANLINPIAGVIATLAVDVAPKVVKLVEGINSGDKAEIIQNAIGAFTNCMGVVGQLKSAIGNKMAEFSKDVDAKIYNEAAQTYDNLGQIQDAGYKYETYVKAEMFDQAKQEAMKLNDLSTEMMQGEPTGFATNLDELQTDNFESSTKVLQGGISKDAYITNTNNFDDKWLNQINNNMNADYKDARDLMNIGLDGPKNAPASREYTFISSDFNDNLNRDLNLTGNKAIPKDWDGFVFKQDSTLSYNLSKSPELIKQVETLGEKTNYNFPSKFDISLNDDKNLFRSIHNATIINAKIDAQGNFTGLMYDKYDYIPQQYKQDLFNNSANNAAYLLQQTKRLKNYYVLTPIKFKVNSYN